MLDRCAGYRRAAPFMQRVDAVNLLGRWPGPQGKGSAFPLAEARAAALALDVAGRARVLLAGRRVAAAWPWRAPSDYLRWEAGPGGVLLAVIPHPSGVNRWWNEPEHRDAARRFLRAATRAATPRR